MAYRPKLPDKYERIASGDLTALGDSEYIDPAEVKVEPDPNYIDPAEVQIDTAPPVQNAGRLTGGGGGGDVVDVEGRLFRPARPSLPGAPPPAAPEATAPGKVYTEAQKDAMSRGLVPFDPSKGDRMGGDDGDKAKAEDLMSLGDKAVAFIPAAVGRGTIGLAGAVTTMLGATARFSGDDEVAKSLYDTGAKINKFGNEILPERVSSPLLVSEKNGGRESILSRVRSGKMGALDLATELPVAAAESYLENAVPFGGWNALVSSGLKQSLRLLPVIERFAPSVGKFIAENAEKWAAKQATEAAITQLGKNATPEAIDVASRAALGALKSEGPAAVKDLYLASKAFRYGTIVGTSVIEGGNDAADLYQKTGEMGNPVGHMMAGLAAGYIETIGGNFNAMERLLGPESLREAKSLMVQATKVADPGSVIGIAKRLAKIGAEAVHNASGEFAQEFSQEWLSMTDIWANDKSQKGIESLLNVDNLLQSIEAGAQGAIIGVPGGLYEGYEKTKAEPSERPGLPAPAGGTTAAEVLRQVGAQHLSEIEDAKTQATEAGMPWDPKYEAYRLALAGALSDDKLLERFYSHPAKDPSLPVDMATGAPVQNPSVDQGAVSKALENGAMAPDAKTAVERQAPAGTWSEPSNRPGIPPATGAPVQTQEDIYQADMRSAPSIADLYDQEANLDQGEEVVTGGQEGQGQGQGVLAVAPGGQAQEVKSTPSPAPPPLPDRGPARRGPIAIPSTSPVATRAAEEAARTQAPATPVQRPTPPPLPVRSRPTIANAVDKAAHEAATSPLNELQQPTEAQKEAGNYPLGHVNIQGLDVSVENPQGSQRTGTRPDGSQWSTTMQDHYGYIKSTVGKDGDHVDAFIGPNPESNQVFVVNQVNPETGKFDEHKVMVGYDSAEQAQAAYLSNYEQGWQGLGSIVPMSMDQFKEWKDKGTRTAPAVAPRPALPVEKKVSRGVSGVPRGERAAVPEGRKPQRAVERPALPTKEEVNVQGQEGSPAQEQAPTAAPAAEQGTQAEPAGGAAPVAGTNAGPAGNAADDAAENAPGHDVAPQKTALEEAQGMSDEEIAALVNEEEAPKVTGGKAPLEFGPKKEPVIGGPRAPKAPGTALKEAGKELGGAFQDAIAGLGELFGVNDTTTLRAGIGFTEENWNRALPLFKAAWDHVLASGKKLTEFRDLVKQAILQKFGQETWDNTKPYLTAFIVKQARGVDPTFEEAAAPREEAATAQDETIGTGDEFTVENVGGPAENTGAGGKRQRKQKGAVAEKEAENTFNDKGEVWDPFKRALDKAAADSTETSIKKVLNQAARSKAFSFTLQEGATPGVSRYADSIRNDFYTFQEYYVRQVMGRYTSTGFEDKIVGRVKQWSDETKRAEEMESLKTSAAKYLAFAAEISKALNAKNVAEARANIKALLWDPAIFEPSLDSQIYRNTSNATYQTEFFKSNTDKLPHSIYSFYRTIQSAHFEADENEQRRGPKPFARTYRKDITRIGLEDYRKGKNIESTDAFDEPFDFKGVAFGSWVEQKERQRVVNGAFDAFHDLAMVMGIDTQRIPFTGRMQIQFGNIGTLNSRAAALYVPTSDAINLSKTSGDGALAHEWGHALDKHLKNDAAPAEGWEKNRVLEARNDLYKRLTYRLDLSAGEEFIKGLFGQAEYYRRYMRQGSETALETLKRVAEQGFEKAVKVDSQFQQNAEAAPNAQYYSKNEEMWARAFEAWVYDQLKEKGAENSYLVDEFASDGFLTPENGYKATIYPAGDERKQFNEYFTAFTKALLFNEDGTIGIDPEYKMIQASELEQIIKHRDALLARIEELYNEKFPAVKSEDGLYWYAYKETKRAKTMQPEGYFAYDDEHSSGEDGQGAVGYTAPLSLDQMLDFHLAAISHVANDKTVYLKEGEEHVEERVEGPRGVALEDIETEDVSNTGGERVPGGRSGLSGEPSEEGLSGAPETGGEGGSGEGGGNGQVDIPSERGGDAGTATGPDAVLPAASNYLIEDASAFSGSRTVAERFSDNVAAIRILKMVEEAGRLPDAAEKDVLAKYSGWGGLGESLSDYGSYSWDSKRQIVQKLMTREERQGLLESSDVAYFTPADIYAATYKALEHMGFQGGKIIGPALGIGREFGTLPAHLRGPQTTLMAVEPEPFSYRISKLLYGQASIKNTTFEKAHLPLNHFDLGISNVPFRAVAPFDKMHNRESFVLHDYFFRKQLHLLRPGGMIAFITSTGTMDKEAALLRNTLVKEGAEFIAAFRLPAIHNQANALADLIFIRKTVPGAALESPAWQKTKDFAAAGQTVSAKVNEYFVDHPERILGTATVATNRWGDLAMQVEQRQGENPADLIEAAIPTLPKDIMKQERVEEEIKAEDLLPAPGEVRNKTYFIKDGVLYYNDNGNSLSQEGEFKAEFVPIVKGLVGLKEAVWDLFRAESNGHSEEEVVAARKALNEKYDEFVEKYGYASDNASLIEDDEQMPILVALEKRDESTDTVSKADLFRMRTLPKYVIPTHADNIEDALMFSLSYRGRADLQYIQGLTGMNPETIFEQLQGKIFDDPASGITTRDDYLSGNVKEKLRQAEASAKVDPKYQVNVEALKAVQPSDIPTSDIYMPLGSSIVPAADVATFLDSHLDLASYRLQAIVKHSERLNAWSIKFTGQDRYGRTAGDTEIGRRIQFMQGSAAYQKHGVQHKEGTAVKLISSMLNSQPIVLKNDPLFMADREVQDLLDKRTKALKEGKSALVISNIEQGIEKARGYRAEIAAQKSDNEGKLGKKVDEKLTTLANDKAAALQEAWAKHWKTSDRALELSRIYNETNNTEVLYKADGSHLARSEKNPGALPGMSAAIKMNPHQLNAIWRYITKGSTYLAHEVGTGKTWVMAAIAMEARRLGLKKKPVFLADGPAKIRQVEGDILQLYPLAKVLVIDVKEDPQKQKIALSRIRTGDYDIVVMTKQSFQRIPLSPEQETIFLQSQVDELMQYESAMDKSDKKTVAAVAKKIAALKAKIEKLLAQKTGGNLDSVYFDDLGIDLILADEAHDFKNIPFETKLRGQGSKVRGLSGKASGRATDFFAKSMFMNATYPRGIVMASGTPLTNSIAELYNISRILQPQELERRGIGHFDAWISMFGQIKSEPEFSPSMDGYRMAQKITMMNLPELKKMFRSVMDYVSTAEAGIKVPEIRDGKPENVMIEQNQDLAAYQKVLLRRTQAYLADPKHAEWNGIPDNMMVIVGQGKTAANDMRLLDSTYKEQENSKLVQAANRIYAEWVATKADKGVQLVFSDLGAPGWSKGEDKKLPQDALDAMDPDARLRYETAQFEVSNSGWNFYDGLKEKLVSMGIPAEEIEFIQSHPSGEKARDKWYKKTFQAVRDGKIRVFLGSSKTLGTGVNVQDRVTAVHHIDIWWTAADWLQRNGRAIRQGNTIAPKYGGVAIYNYGVKKTADAFVWDKVQTKLKTISSVESTNMSLRMVEDVSDDVMSAIEAAAVFSGDTTYVELAKVQAELRKLEYRESEFLDDRKRAESDLQQLPGKMQAAEKSIERTKSDLALLEPVDAVKFDDDEQVYVFEKHGKLIAEKLEKVWKDKKTQDQLDISVSTNVHIATLGKATEKIEPAAEPVLDAEGKPVKAEKPKKTYDFADVPVRVYLRTFTYGLKGDRAGVVLGLSGKLTANMEKPFTEGAKPITGAASDETTYHEGDLLWAQAKSGKLGEVVGHGGEKIGNPYVVVKNSAKLSADPNPIVGNLSRTVTLSRTALAAKAEQSASEMESMKKSEAGLQEVLDRTFPDTEKILELRGERERLEQQQRDQAASGYQPATEEGAEEEGGPSFSAPTGEEVFRPAGARRPVNYKEGADSRGLSDLKKTLLADPRFSQDPEMRARIEAIQEVVSPDDEEAILTDRIHKILGPEARVVLVDSAGVFREVQHEVVGVGNYVFVDIRAPQPLHSLVAHGLWHADKSKYKQVLIDVLRKTVDPKRFQEMAREFRAVAAYSNLSDNALWEEFGARFLEGQITQESFWDALSKRSRVVYLRMAKWVIDTLNKLGIKIGEKPPVWGEYFSTPEKMAEAVRAAQDYFLNKLGDLGRGEGPAKGPRMWAKTTGKTSAPVAKTGPAVAAAVNQAISEGRQGKFSAGPSLDHLFTRADENPMVPPGVSEDASVEDVTSAIRKDPVWGRIFLNVPDKDLTPFMRTAALPWWLAKTDPQGRRVMNVQLARDDERNEMFVSLTRSQAGMRLSDAAGAELDDLIARKGGVEKTTANDIIAFARNENTELHKAFGWKTSTPETHQKLANALLRRGQIHEFLDLDFKEAEALGKAIVDSDAFVEMDDDGKIVKAGKVLSVSDLEERGFNQKQITAYYAWKNGMDAAWNTKLTYAKASIFWPYMGKDWMNWTTRKTGFQSLKALPISDLEKVSEGTMTVSQAKDNIRLAAASRGYDPEKAFKAFSKALDRVKEPFGKIQKYREQWGKVKFYMPRFRDQGPIVIRVAGENEGDKDLFYRRYNPLPGTSLSREAKVDYDRLVEEHGYDAVEFYRSPVIPENIYGDISEAALEKFVGRAIGRLQNDGEIDPEEAEALTESIFQELANDLNVRGFGQRSMPRAAGDPTKGYKEDHFQEIYRNYMSGMAGFLSKRKAAMEFNRALSDMRPQKDAKTGKPKGQQRWQAFDYWRRYAEDMLRNQDRGDELSAKVRSLAFLYFISGNLKGAAVNLTQSFASTMPVGSTITKGAEGKVLKAMRDVAFGRISKMERIALQEAHDRGETTAQYIEDIMDKANAGGRDAIFKKISHTLSIPFRKAEIFNRKVAFLFAYRIFSSQNKTHGESMNLARDFVNDTQYLFGKANLPEWARSGTGVGKIMRTSYTFRSYSHNYLNSMAHFLSKDPDNGKDSREFQVLARSLAYLAILGGAGAGLPFLDDLLDILERETGIRWRSQVRNYLGKHFGPVATKFWTAGLPGMFGFDISGSLKIGLPSTLSPEDTVYGVYGGMIDKGAQAMQMAASQQYLRAAETALPSFAANPLRAVREATVGSKTITGGTKFDEKGKPLKMTPGEAVGRAAGFRPVRDTISSQEKREYDNLRSHYTDKRSQIYASYRSARPADRVDVIRDARSYNREILKFRGVVPAIDMNHLRSLAHQKPSKSFMNYERYAQQ